MLVVESGVIIFIKLSITKKTLSDIFKESVAVKY